MPGRLLSNALLLLAVVTGLTTAAEDQGRNANQPAVSVTAGQQPADVKEATELGRVAGRNPRVLFITKKGCDRCERELTRLRRPGGDFESMQARGWKIGESASNHIQLVDAEKIPDLVRLLNIKEYPTVACVGDGEILRSFKDGCSTPLDAWTFGWLLKGQNERPQAPIPEPIRVASTGHYPLRGNHWSIDGDPNPTEAKLVSHIRGPNHAYQLASEWQIETWSYEELRSLHDDLHERSDAPVMSYSASQFTSRGADQVGAGRKILGR